MAGADMIRSLNSVRTTVSRFRACWSPLALCDIAGKTVPVPPAVHAYCSLKLIVTVMTTGTALPFSSVGVNSHCRTASSAA